eukprot:31462-Pelagococcus_subviridis.AAC.4
MGTSRVGRPHDPPVLVRQRVAKAHVLEQAQFRRERPVAERSLHREVLLSDLLHVEIQRVLPEADEQIDRVEQRQREVRRVDDAVDGAVMIRERRPRGDDERGDVDDREHDDETTGGSKARGGGGWAAPRVCGADRWTVGARFHHARVSAVDVWFPHSTIDGVFKIVFLVFFQTVVIAARPPIALQLPGVRGNRPRAPFISSAARVDPTPRGRPRDPAKEAPQRVDAARIPRAASNAAATSPLARRRAETENAPSGEIRPPRADE